MSTDQEITAIIAVSKILAKLSKTQISNVMGHIFRHEFGCDVEHDYFKTTLEDDRGLKKKSLSTENLMTLEHTGSKNMMETVGRLKTKIDVVLLVAAFVEGQNGNDRFRANEVREALADLAIKPANMTATMNRFLARDLITLLNDTHRKRVYRFTAKGMQKVGALLD
ncbi:MAG: hypothetical protein V3V74_07065 [Nitrosomonadaceae bacterium]